MTTKTVFRCIPDIKKLTYQDYYENCMWWNNMLSREKQEAGGVFQHVMPWN